MSKKKVLFISHWYPTKDKPNAGIFIKRHADAFAEISDQTIIHFNLKQSSKILQISLKRINSKQFEILVDSFFYKFLYYFLPLHFYLLKRLVKKYDIRLSEMDYVHSNVIFPSGIIGYKISKKYKIPQFHSEHWSKFNYFIEKDFWKRTGKKAILNIEKIFPVSEFFKSQISLHVPESKMFVIPNIIDSEKFYFEQRNNSNRSKLIFLSVANWQKPKNPYLFLDALESIYLEKKLDFEFRIAGNGPILNEILSKKYSFPIVKLGLLNAEEIAINLKDANFLLHGSEFETFSVIIVESLKVGTPVLVSNVGIAPEVINAENGYICYSNVQDWKLKIMLAAETTYDNEKIAKKIEKKFNKLEVNLLMRKFYNA
jgi:glycosyltransferase involved in cell wall biosynthesis